MERLNTSLPLFRVMDALSKNDALFSSLTDEQRRVVISLKNEQEQHGLKLFFVKCQAYLLCVAF